MRITIQITVPNDPPDALPAALAAAEDLLRRLGADPAAVPIVAYATPQEE